MVSLMLAKAALLSDSEDVLPEAVVRLSRSEMRLEMKSVPEESVFKIPLDPSAEKLASKVACWETSTFAEDVFPWNETPVICLVEASRCGSKDFVVPLVPEKI